MDTIAAIMPTMTANDAQDAFGKLL